MGVFSEVILKCAICGGTASVQVSDYDELTYTVDDAPRAALVEAAEHRPIPCSGCGRLLWLEVAVCPVVRIQGGES